MTKKALFLALCLILSALATRAAIDGSLDPQDVVAQWSNQSTYPKVIDINFNDDTWPDVWPKETGKDCPEWADGGYVNAIIKVQANGSGDVKYPVLFHNCTFANKNAYNGFAGCTAAFARQYYLGEKATGNSADKMNNWTVAGHTNYLEDNITRNASDTPTHGEAGFVQFCRNGALEGTTTSLHGWMEIDHIPYVDRVQWSWSSTSWGRGIKCDYKIGDGEWQPLVWMGSDKHKVGYTVFSDQGYFMESLIGQSDVSLRWRVWDGERAGNPVQNGSVFSATENPLAQVQTARVHKIQIFGNTITPTQAEYAATHPEGDVGELSDLGGKGSGDGDDDAPDKNANVVVKVVAQDGSGDFTSVQQAIDAIQDGDRGIIYIKNGVYDENIYSGTKASHGKFISLIGESKENTILTSSTSRGSQSAGTITYNDCAALNVFTSRFYAENLTIRNTSGKDAGQAEALFTNADAHVFKNCLISGFQDTYKANSGNRGYFTGCTIEGGTDFIYDSGLEWFEGCQIRCLQGGSYITAAGQSSMSMTRTLWPSLSQETFRAGLFFRNCDVVGDGNTSAGSYYLGRPWNEQAGTMFLKCRLGDVVKPEGWAAWSGNENSCSYLEYQNTAEDGTALDVSSRAAFSHQATAEEVEAYMNPEFLFNNFSKAVSFNYTNILKGAATPMNFTVSGTEITWESDDKAAAYIVYRDGVMQQITTEPRITKAADDMDQYSVASVSRQGVTSPVVVAKEASTLLAFPTAEGFGKYATGGRGGHVVYVTSLEDDGTDGTLRWAFDQYKGEPLTIMFQVSGNIVLQKELRVNRSDWTLAGQTAPGMGIVITHNKVNLGGSQNFIVRNVRFRIGQKSVADEVLCDNALGAENCSNYIFDHCNFGWSVEENMNTADSHFLTVQHSIVHEGLYNAGHSKGSRGYGCQWGGSPATYHHNLLTGNHSRSCRFNGARGEDNVVFLEYANNVNFNYGDRGGCYGGENTAAISSYNGLNSAHECNFMNNYYKPGPASSKSKVCFVNSSYARDGATSWAPSKWFVSGNVAEGFTDESADNWLAMEAEHYTLEQIKSQERITPQTPYYKYTVAGTLGKYVPEKYMLSNVETAEAALQTIIQKCGTISRDITEMRIIDDLENGTASCGGSTLGATSGMIDTEEDAEGFQDYPTDYEVPQDTDMDGMPDAWETANGLDPSTADNNRLNDEGYTALEVYLNSLMSETQSNQFTGINAVMSTSKDFSYDPKSGTLTVSGNALGGTLSVYATNGSLLWQGTADKESLRLPRLNAGVVLIQLQGRNIAPRVIKTRL